MKRRKGLEKDWATCVEPALYPIRINVCGALNMTLEEFAKLAKSNPQTILDWERDVSDRSEYMRCGALYKLASLYGIPTSAFDNANELFLYYGAHREGVINHVSKLRG